MSSQESVREAWVTIPTEEEHRASLPPGAPAGNYDFGYLPAMGRLQARHKEIGPLFGALVPPGDVRPRRAGPAGTGDGGGGGRRSPGLPLLNRIPRRVSAFRGR